MSSPKSPMRVSFDGAAEVTIPLHACGWGYANAGCKLHQTAARCGLPRICDFFTPKGHVGELPWHGVANGLVSIAGLRTELQARPDSVCDAACSLRDLAELEQVLAAAPTPRFRLRILCGAEQAAELPS
ncbi:MAG TPA: hypothetical protein PKD86_09625 [Gemmatales bacterium]|nr:hypothetical protein [Gemmatales bacterium]HMP59600.1 hypothetical protein [Gemmatales bacterium]